jgi:hypothetical protein
MALNLRARCTETALEQRTRALLAAQVRIHELEQAQSAAEVTRGSLESEIARLDREGRERDAVQRSHPLIRRSTLRVLRDRCVDASASRARDHRASQRARPELRRLDAHGGFCGLTFRMRNTGEPVSLAGCRDPDAFPRAITISGQQSQALLEQDPLPLRQKLQCSGLNGMRCATEKTVILIKQFPDCSGSGSARLCTKVL